VNSGLQKVGRQGRPFFISAFCLVRLIIEQTVSGNRLHAGIILSVPIRVLAIKDSSPHFPALLSGELSEVVRAAFQN